MAEGAKLYIDVKAPGGTKFKINEFHGVERLSDLFEYSVLMTAQDRDVSFDSMIGKSATVTIGVGSLERSFNGIIGKFEQVHTPFKSLKLWTVYRATLFPKLWLLTFSGQCRIFQNKTTVEIIKKVLEENQIPFTDQIRSAGQKTREYCVQYNETNFNFISRLMEEEGIFYFFEQKGGNHKLILADSVQAHSPCQNASKVAFHDAAPVDQFMMKVSSCFITQQIVPKSNTLKSYNYLTPQTPLKANADGTRDAGGGNLTSYHQIYTKQSRGDELVKVRLQSEESPQKRVNGVSTVPFFLAGYKFKLEQHPRRDANQDYVLFEVIHEAAVGHEDNAPPLYKNTYTAFPLSIPFRAEQKTPKPRIFSTQTAKVTGKKREEIYTEEYGRIKVKFHWDPSNKNDETTSCWIRVATLWSGQKWGTLFTPRIGQEVVVSFIDGDPDKPLIVGSVYNGDHKPPYLPNRPTVSTIKSQTSKVKNDSNPGFNELRFEDKRYSEEIYMHAQKDFKMDIQNDHEITIVGGSRKIVLKAEEEIHERRKSRKSNDSLKLVNGNKSLQIIKGNYKIQLLDGNITVTCLNGDVKFNVIGDISFKCTGSFSVDALQSINFKAGQSISGMAGMDVSFKAGASASIMAGASASVKAGASLDLLGGATASLKAAASASITGGAAVDIKGGGAVDINGGGAVSLKGGTVDITGGMIMLG